MAVMMRFTSGTQARDSRKVNHDPDLKWKVWLETSYAMHGHREWIGSAKDWDDALVQAEAAFPKFTAVSAHWIGRPEFDVLDNKHLALARWAFQDDRGGSDRLAFYKEGYDYLNRKLWSQGHLSDEDEFARRVFEHLLNYAQLP